MKIKCVEVRLIRPDLAPSARTRRQLFQECKFKCDFMVIDGLSVHSKSISLPFHKFNDFGNFKDDGDPFLPFDGLEGSLSLSTFESADATNCSDGMTLHGDDIPSDVIKQSCSDDVEDSSFGERDFPLGDNPRRNFVAFATTCNSSLLGCSSALNVSLSDLFVALFDFLGVKIFCNRGFPCAKVCGGVNEGKGRGFEFGTL
mmetsp:Transcript_22706/g.34654  ORF Transcript_22706/g.34654 Transcript_22706/m.34654 type:complete len:201 (-) Transcript_22706:2260-2862(-)